MALNAIEIDKASKHIRFAMLVFVAFGSEGCWKASLKLHLPPTFIVKNLFQALPSIRRRSPMSGQQRLASPTLVWQWMQHMPCLRWDL